MRRSPDSAGEPGMKRSHRARSKSPQPESRSPSQQEPGFAESAGGDGIVDIVRLAVMGSVMETATDENGAPLNFQGWRWGLGARGLAGVRGDHKERGKISVPSRSWPEPPKPGPNLVINR